MLHNERKNSFVAYFPILFLIWQIIEKLFLIFLGFLSKEHNKENQKEIAVIANQVKNKHTKECNKIIQKYWSAIATEGSKLAQMTVENNIHL